MTGDMIENPLPANGKTQSGTACKNEEKKKIYSIMGERRRYARGAATKSSPQPSELGEKHNKEKKSQKPTKKKGEGDVATEAGHAIRDDSWTQRQKG